MSGAGEAREWFRLEAQLLLAGAEERRRPGLVLYRDCARPRFWDRQLAVAEGVPESPALDLAALDGFYREARVEQWSMIALDDSHGRAWEKALVPAGLGAERVRLMSKVPAAAAGNGVVRILDPADVDRLRRLMVASSGEAMAGPVAGQVLDVLAVRAEAGLGASVLVIEERGEVIAGITLTSVRDRVWLEDLMVDPEHRGAGLGRMLLAAAEAEAVRRGARICGLSAAAADWPAVWYARAGYRRVGEVLRLRRLL